MNRRQPAKDITISDLKRFRSLLQKKYREDQRMYLVEGVRLCEELVRSPAIISTVLYAPDFGEKDQRQQQLQRIFKEHKIVTYRISQKQFDAISATEQSQGVVAVCRRSDEPAEKLAGRLTGSPVVLLDRIVDPGNLGTIIRTCAWFGTAAVFISKESVDLYNPKVVRATMGGLFRIPVANEADLSSVIALLKKNGYSIYTSLPADAEPLDQVRFTPRSAILFGNEAEGVDPSLIRMADHLIMIPGGNVESLSVSVAAGIILEKSARKIPS